MSVRGGFCRTHNVRRIQVIITFMSSAYGLAGGINELTCKMTSHQPPVYVMLLVISQFLVCEREVMPQNVNIVI